MSRFWGGGSGSDSSSSDSDVSEDEVAKPTVNTGGFKNTFDSDSDDEGQRVVKSKKDRLIEQMEELVAAMKNKIKIKDWAKVEEQYKELNQLLEKNKRDLLTEDKSPPRQYLKMVVELENHVADAWIERKKMDKTRAKAVTNLRTGMKKFGKNAGYEERINQFRANPDPEPVTAAPATKKTKTKKASTAGSGSSSSGSSSSGSDSDSDSDAPAPKTALKPKPAFEKTVNKDDDDDDDDDIDWGSSSGGELTDSGSETEGFGYTASMFLKKAVGGPKEATEAESRRQAKVEAALEEEKKKAAAEDEDDSFEEVGKQKKKKKNKGFEFNKDDKITVDAVMEKLQGVVMQRGKKGVLMSDQMVQLRYLRTKADGAGCGAGLSCLIQMQIVSAHFDNIKSVSSHMDDTAWRVCHDDIVEILLLGRAHTNLVISPAVAEEDEILEDVEGAGWKVMGDLITFVERLDAENVKSMQNTDPHSLEYVERLKFEVLMYNLIIMMEQHTQRPEYTMIEKNRITLRRVQHIYYKREYVPSLKHLTDAPAPQGEPAEPAAVAASEAAAAKAAEAHLEAGLLPFREIPVCIDVAEEKDSTKLMAKLCQTLYEVDTDDRVRTRAILCHIYHHALHNRWYKARDMMLMSHLQEVITNSDIDTQILYNRTMVQLGLCAFRHGLIQDSHMALHDIYASNRVKELLAQGIVNMRNQERTAEEIMIQKRRQTPFHMHINIDMMECVYFVCSMLLEIPSMAQGESSKRRFFSKKFGSQLNFWRRNTFSGPPESPRDHVVAASMQLLEGNWKECRDLVMSLKVWTLFPDQDFVTTMLIQKIKEEGLRTYLFVYGGVYETISLVALAEMFELELSVVHSIVSKMIYDEDLQATHDQPTQTIEIHKEEPSLLQSLALKCAETTAKFVENSERLLDQRLGYDGGGRGRGRGRGGGRGRGRGRGGRGDGGRGGYQVGGRGGYQVGGGGRGGYQGGGRGGGGYQGGGGGRGYGGGY